MCKRLYNSRVVLLVVSVLLLSCSGGERELPEITPPPTPRYTANVDLNSTILKSTIKFAIYLPDNYNADKQKRYGVVYLLHGFGDSHNAWENSLKLSATVAKKEAAGEIEPMIYVMPQGFNSYYVNRYDGSYDYMRMFVEELVPLIDRTYRTTARREQRAVVGYSMGGYGAMILPAKNPDLFSVSVPLSMSVRTDQQYMTEPQSGWNSQWGAIFGGSGATGEARLTPYYKEHSPFYLFNEQSAAELARVNFFLDCGDDEEQLSVANDALHILLRQLDIKHQYRVRDGAHTTGYWVGAMQEALNYINACFTARAYPDEVQISLPTSLHSTLDTKSSAGALAGLNVKIYLPEGYATNTAKSYHVVYAGIEGDAHRNVMAALDSLQNVKPFIMAIYNSSQAATFGTTPAQIVQWTEANYRTKAKTLGRIAIGHRLGGKQIYNTATLDASLFGSLFLTDADLDTPFSAPQAPYYYIDITTNGTNYTAANALYLACRNMGKQHEYRVRAGRDSENSMLVGINSMAYYIGLKLNIQ